MAKVASNSPSKLQYVYLYRERERERSNQIWLCKINTTLVLCSQCQSDSIWASLKRLFKKGLSDPIEARDPCHFHALGPFAAPFPLPIHPSALHPPIFPLTPLTLQGRPCLPSVVCPSSEQPHRPSIRIYNSIKSNKPFFFLLLFPPAPPFFFLAVPG